MVSELYIKPNIVNYYCAVSSKKNIYELSNGHLADFVFINGYVTKHNKDYFLNNREEQKEVLYNKIVKDLDEGIKFQITPTFEISVFDNVLDVDTVRMTTIAKRYTGFLSEYYRRFIEPDECGRVHEKDQLWESKMSKVYGIIYNGDENQIITGFDLIPYYREYDRLTQIEDIKNKIETLNNHLSVLENTPSYLPK